MVVTKAMVSRDVGSNTLQTPATFKIINPQDGATETSVIYVRYFTI